MVLALSLSRDQIAATLALKADGKTDFQVVKQMEKLFAAVNTLAQEAGQTDVVDTNVTLDAAGVLLAVDVNDPGTYLVTLSWTATVTGGGGADGWTLSPENSGGFAFTPFDYSLSFTESAASGGFLIPSSTPAYGFSGDPIGVYALTGTMVVTAAGTIGMRFVLTGAPTDATLRAGSRLVVESLS